MSNRSFCALAALIVLTMLLSACAPAAMTAPTTPPPTEKPTAAPIAEPAPANRDMILATTTSTQDSGLLDVFIPLFEQQTGFKVKVVAVGTGQALQMGQEGNADVLLVHAPSSEKTYMEGGFGKDRFLVMHNDFIIVGPGSDPAGIKGEANAVDAFSKIAAAAAPFVSRADKSGTNSKELALWKSAKLDPATTRPAWYIETGQGMGATLTIASEKSAYTLSDRGTYLATKANLELDVLVEKDTALLNVYHVITVNPARWPKVNYDGAIAFAKWLTQPEIQTLIQNFGIDKYSEPLFIPDADRTDADLGL
ncbi:MAG TPA: substrate-binding domain-containing protein [Anaerolineales bacterium]|nr:substrate-binding domain-containing protein [Anaerolineales bacterium]